MLSKIIEKIKDYSISIIIFLLYNLIAIISLKFSSDTNLSNIIAIATGITSIILAFLAIIYSFIGNESFSKSFHEMSLKITRLDEIIEQIKNNIIKSNESTYAIDRIETYPNNKIDTKLGDNQFDTKSSVIITNYYTRFHFRINFYEDINFNQISSKIINYFKDDGIIDYSLLYNKPTESLFIDINFSHIEGIIIINKNLNYEESEHKFNEAVKNASSDMKYKIVNLKIGYIKHT